MRMHVDATTEKRSAQKAKQGDQVMAKVDDQGHAISFLTDRDLLLIDCLTQTCTRVEMNMNWRVTNFECHASYI